jgi:succinyl-CoA synthetase alpha subunit
MAILADENSRIMICGIDDPLARFQCHEMLRHGTQLVGIVGTEAELAGWEPPAGVPVFPTVQAATGKANLAVVLSQPLECKRVIQELIAARIGVIACLSEHVPVHDAILLKELARRAGVTLVGPNSSGLLSPGRAKAGFFVEDICLPGRIGLIAKSGSLAYAVMAELKSAGIGISTVVAIGGDTAKGTDIRDCLRLFALDHETDAIVVLGEIGGSDEERAAAYLHQSPVAKPIIAFISGRSVPPGHSMGHAGAIARQGRGDYTTKCRALSEAGIRIVDNIGEIAPALSAISRPTLADTIR